jgi:phosphoglycolate phosphatase
MVLVYIAKTATCKNPSSSAVKSMYQLIPDNQFRHMTTDLSTTLKTSQQTNKPSLRGIVFDLDGTLLNCPYDFAAMRQAVLEIAAEMDLRPESLAGIGILEAIIEGEKLLGGEAGREFEHRANTAVLQLELLGAEQSKPLPGVQETLHWLHENGLKTAIITRNSTKVVEALLQHVEFKYDVLLPREAVVNVKPHPEHLLVALEQLHCEPNEALMVGDHVWDIECGRATGVISVGVTSGASTRDRLIQAGAAAVLESVRDLPVWLVERYHLPVNNSSA